MGAWGPKLAQRKGVVINMKKYKRKTSWLSPLKLAVAAMCAVVVSAVSIPFLGFPNEWQIIGGGIAAALLFAAFFTVLGVTGQYSYSDTYIDISYLSVSYKKLDYAWYSTIVICNASYNNGLGYGAYGSIPMQYPVKGHTGHTKVPFPFITLHKPDYPLNKLKKGMSSWDLFILRKEELYCLGICWFDSLKELLEHTQCPVYVLEDVYLRFKGMFDPLFTQHEESERFYIITDHPIQYTNYKGSERL